MLDRAFNILGVVVMPITAMLFARDIYTASPANFSVWFFAFLGVFHTFLPCLTGLMGDR